MRIAQSNEISRSGEVPIGAPFTVVAEGPRLVCVYRKRAWAGVAFGAVWLIVWATFSAVFSAHVVAEPTPGLVVLMIAVWSACVLMPFIWVSTSIRDERLTIGGNQLVVEQRTPFRRTERRIRLTDLRGFACKPFYDRADTYWIAIQTDGRSLNFALALPKKSDSEWLAARLNAHTQILVSGADRTDTEI